MVKCRRVMIWGGRLTNITPDRRPVDRVVLPDNRVDELVEARKPGPEDINTATSIPGCRVGQMCSAALNHRTYMQGAI